MEIAWHCKSVEWYERAKQIMKLQGMSQAELARRIEESESNVSRYFAGTRNQDSISSARKIANALGVSLDHLILGKPDYLTSNSSQQIQPLLDLTCKILTRGSPGLQAALSSNIIQFSELLELKEECHKLASDNEELRNRVAILEQNKKEDPDSNERPPQPGQNPDKTTEKAGLRRRKAM